MPYHARVADALLAQLGKRGREELRDRIASGIARQRAEGTWPDSSLDGFAGESRERMVRAVDEALDGLAFHRAAELHQAVLEGPDERGDVPRARLLLRLGEAHIACGLGAAGADAFLRAAAFEAAGSAAHSPSSTTVPRRRSPSSVRPRRASSCSRWRRSGRWR